MRVGGQCQQYVGQLPNLPTLPGDAVVLEQHLRLQIQVIPCWLLDVACSWAGTDGVLGLWGLLLLYCAGAMKLAMHEQGPANPIVQYMTPKLDAALDKVHSLTSLHLPVDKSQYESIVFMAGALELLGEGEVRTLDLTKLAGLWVQLMDTCSTLMAFCGSNQLSTTATPVATCSSGPRPPGGPAQHAST